VHLNLGVEQQFCRTPLVRLYYILSCPNFRPLGHAHIVDVSGHRESEVDARNILPETSACSRAPTARKRAAEEAIEERYTKKVEKLSQKSLQIPPILINLTVL
jgi:hypothetical protein